MGGKKRKKTWLWIPLAAVAAAVVGVGAWFALKGGGEPVNVYPFMYVGMTEYWGDNQESYGPVSADNFQTVFLSDTQTITEIRVKEGDQVKKGDILMTFDTTLDALAVERKGIELEKMRLEWKDTIHELEDVKNMEPMYIPEYYPEEEPTEPDLGVELKKSDKKLVYTGLDKERDGTTKEKAIIWWMHTDSAKIDNDKILEFWNYAKELKEPEEVETPPQQEEEEDKKDPNVIYYDPKDGLDEPSDATDGDDKTEENHPEDEKDREEKIYLILKVTEDNMSNGYKTLWQGLEITKVEKAVTGAISWYFQFFDASAMTDFTMVEVKEPEPTEPEIYIGSGYTKQELLQMRNDLEKKIKEQEFNIRMAEAEYKLMQWEVSDGNVYADTDGEIISVLSEEEARQLRQPLIKLSGGGGFFVEGSVSELEKEKLLIGQEVTINDWNTGNTYTGEVREVGDFPTSDDGWNGMGNPNASYYPFRVFIDGEADLQAGSYVSIMYSTSGAEHGVYLENPFIRTENGENYVLVMGSDGRIEKRIVTVGKSLWGSYQEILAGITEADLIAFPYGKNVKVGAPAVESDISALYGY